MLNINNKRPSWDQYFLQIAKVVATRSQCLRAKHGAVVVDANNRILSTGYNNPPPKIISCEEAGECLIVERPNYGPSCRRTIHAEFNAINYLLSNNQQLLANKIYISGTPCNNCLEYILKCGIKNIICGADYNSEYGKEEREALLKAFNASIGYIKDAN